MTLKQGRNGGGKTYATRNMNATIIISKSIVNSNNDNNYVINLILISNLN